MARKEVRALSFGELELSFIIALLMFLYIIR